MQKFLKVKKYKRLRNIKEEELTLDGNLQITESLTKGSIDDDNSLETDKVDLLKQRRELSRKRKQCLVQTVSVISDQKEIPQPLMCSFSVGNAIS